MSNSKERRARQNAIKEIIKEYGYDKAVRKLQQAGYCVSKAEARRVIKHIKIKSGDKKLRHEK